MNEHHQPQALKLVPKLIGFRKRWHWLGVTSCAVLALASVIPIRLAIAAHQAPKPEAVLVLGGGTGREEFAAQFGLNHPSLDIWVSGGRYPEGPKIFRQAGIDKKRVHFDWYAVDTISNFTLSVDDFERRRIQHLYLITSEEHMPRAKVIATLILGSRGITFTPVTIPSNQAPGPWLSIGRDSVRALFWIATGRSGAGLTRLLK
ncbi:YdcF family protein [Leptolyngbya sp. FACHB-261]|uniref:YdcF family protein n=1 Tax=Leptolyngbya sp. FACHB-261 TaxID=2692806 RepID=UPI0016856A6B|nr:YdcF family protein [Leptolyngbya sp. FACHB-261]MBD2102618.1 YdcF family protein [Leptolyngbya sp. FACHB-261]